MYRCHPQVARVLDLIRDGAVGEVVEVRSAFGWQSRFDAASRIHDPAQGGGAILDVGTYPVSLARLLAGAATGEPFADPEVVAGTGRLYGEGGVDGATARVVEREAGEIISSLFGEQVELRRPQDPAPMEHRLHPILERRPYAHQVRAGAEAFAKLEHFVVGHVDLGQLEVGARQIAEDGGVAAVA